MSESETRGILTESDKNWLRGEIEYEHRQTAADRRAQIRNRVAAALQDFSLLTEHWSSAERQKMIEELDDSEQSAAEIVEFLYLILNEPATDPEEMIDKGAVDQALAFRSGLCRGIKAGKEHFGDAPDSVLIDSNTELFEVPSVEEFQRTINTDQWRNANNHVRGAFNAPDDAAIDKDEAAGNYHTALHLTIGEELYSRRQRSDAEIKRHDHLVRSPGF